MQKKTNFTTLFQSVEHVKNYLQKNYEARGITAATEYAFQNSYTFVYYIKLGESYFSQGIQAPTSIKPVLFFYGLSHWLKAGLLLADPEYPATTQVLAHGVSARKRKKQGYKFLSDEIKVQKDGFFPYISAKLFHVKQLPGEKYKMRHLLNAVPEMNDTFEKLEKEKAVFPVMKNSDNEFAVSSGILKKLHLSPKRFERMVKEKVGTSLSCQDTGDVLLIHLENEDRNLPFLSSYEGNLYLPGAMPVYWKLPEILSHFLILYNLSMICRYEAEWWGEVLFSFASNDRPFIDSFLSCVQEKTPMLVEQLLYAEE